MILIFRIFVYFSFWFVGDEMSDSDALPRLPYYLFIQAELCDADTLETLLAKRNNDKGCAVDEAEMMHLFVQVRSLTRSVCLPHSADARYSEMSRTTNAWCERGVPHILN